MAADNPKMYVDSCCIIDAAKYKDASFAPADRRDDVAYIQQILKAAKDGNVIVYTSSLTIAECQHTGDHPPSEEVKRLFKSILTSGKVVRLIADSIFIAERARDLRWDHDITLRGADSIHVASAIEEGCTEFITSDGRGPHKNAAKIAKLGLKVVRASETELLPVEYKEPQQTLQFDPAVQETVSEIIAESDKPVSEPSQSSGTEKMVPESVTKPVAAPRQSDDKTDKAEESSTIDAKPEPKPTRQIESDDDE